MMLAPPQSTQAWEEIRWLRRELKTYLPHGRGKKPDFNLSVCFTEVLPPFHNTEGGGL